MDWKLLATTFTAVFIAELGDKTQLATLSLASGKRAWLPVLIGAASALVCTSILAVAVGATIGKYVPENVVKRAAGGLFVLLGVWMLVKPL
jgi:putative Ca2+/H+ antiporter (TMEM165/GDT1 family)